MALWRIDIFANEDDERPYRSGYVHADNEVDASEKVVKAMGDDARGYAEQVRSYSVPTIPTDRVLWDLFDDGDSST